MRSICALSLLVFAPFSLGAFSNSGFPPQEQATCWYEISTGASGVQTLIPSDGGTITISIKTSAGCSWTVSAGADWITVKSGSGTGDGTATLEVAPNTGIARAGAVTVADYHFFVLQAAGASCTFKLSGPTIALSGSGATATIQVTAPDGCEWNVSTSTEWIAVQGSGSGSGAIIITVAPNPAAEERSGAVTVAGSVFPIRQAGTPPPCTYTYSGLELLAQHGGSSTFDLITPPSCEWTVASTVSWITITSSSGGTGDAKIAFTVEPNTGVESRSGIIKIAGLQIVVKQEGTGCTYAFPGAAQILSSIPGAGIGITLQINAPAACSWTLRSDADWIRIPAGPGGAGDGEIRFEIAANATGAPRTGTITIGGRTFEITQPAQPCEFTLSGTVDSATGGKIAVQTGGWCQWQAATGAAWVRIKTASGAGPSTVDIDLEANPGTSERTATVTIGGQEFRIVQAPIPVARCSYAFSPATLPSALGSGGSVSIDVDAPPVCFWAIGGAPGWITIDGGTSRMGSGTVRLIVAPNATGGPRSATVTIAGQTVTVEQPALLPECTYTLDKAAELAVESASASLTVGVTAPPGCPWKADLNAKWLHIDPEAGGTGAGTLRLAIDVNPGGTPRQAQLLLGGSAVTVTQAGQPGAPPEGGIVNAANPQSTPIARGSIFSINGAAMPAGLPAEPDLGEIAITVTQGSVTVNALPLHASALRILALMPPDAPLGDVAITVIYKGGSAGSTAGIVPASPGVFASSGGHAAAQNWLSGTEHPLNTRAAPATPGQTVILWATGLGGAAAGTGLPPVEVTVGGKAAEVLYSGRSGCCGGADAIIIRLPEDAWGCEVPVRIKAGGSDANPVSISISADGAACKEGVPADGKKTGLILLVRSTIYTNMLPFLPSISSTADQAIAHFYEPGSLSAGRPLSYPQIGACTSYRTDAAGGINSLPGPWKELIGSGFGRELDAGESLSLAAPNGRTYTLPRGMVNNGAAAGPYWATLGISMSAVPAALALTAGPFTVTGAGGAEVGAFTATATFPGALDWTNRNTISSVDRTSPLTIAWTGAGTHDLVLIAGTATERNGVSAFLCSAAGEDGMFRIPASILGGMPASTRFDPLSTLIVGAIASRDPATFTASGLDRGLVLPASLSAKTVTYK